MFKKSHPSLVILAMLIFLSSLTGCSTHASKSQELLDTEFLNLNDEALLLHYYEIEDQIYAVEQRRSSPSVSLGLGLGSFGGHSSVGAGVGVTTRGSQPEVGADLRAHKNRVRLELQKRGITP